jgi:hypothetical protein
MPGKKVTDPITDQETTFARLVMSGTMTDRQAAEAAGLKPWNYASGIMRQTGLVLLGDSF